MTARIRVGYRKGSSSQSGRYILLGVGLIFLVIGLFFGTRSVYRSIFWKNTAVTVLDISEKKTTCTKKKSRSGKKRKKKYPCIKFTAHASLSVQGTIYELTFPAGSRREEQNSGPAFKVGTTIPIIYNPADPNSYEKAESGRFLPAILFSLLGGALTFLGFKLKDKGDSTTDRNLE